MREEEAVVREEAVKAAKEELTKIQVKAIANVRSRKTFRFFFFDEFNEREWVLISLACGKNAINHHGRVLKKNAIHEKKHTQTTGVLLKQALFANLSPFVDLVFRRLRQHFGFCSDACYTIEVLW